MIRHLFLMCATLYASVLYAADKPNILFIANGYQAVHTGKIYHGRMNDMDRSWNPKAEPVQVELYDHQSDPDETVNVAAAQPEVVERLLKQFKAGWREKREHRLNNTSWQGRLCSRRNSAECQDHLPIHRLFLFPATRRSMPIDASRWTTRPA